MASGPSTALVDFRLRLRQPLELMKYESGFHDPPTATQIDLVNGLRGGSIVLMVAAFEAFLRESFEERIDELADRVTPVTFDVLPDTLRTTAVFNLLEDAMKGTPGRPVPEKRVDRIAGVRSAADKVASKTLEGSAFSTTGSNPNSETVKDLFKQAGYSGIWTECHPRFSKLWRAAVAVDFPRYQLDYIVQTRHSIAHGASALSFSRSDLSAAARLLRILAQTLDDELRIHLNKIRV